MKVDPLTDMTVPVLTVVGEVHDAWLAENEFLLEAHTGHPGFGYQAGSDQIAIGCGHAGSGPSTDM